MVGAERNRWKLMKNADSARTRRKGRASEMSKPPTLRVYEEGCPPTSWIAFFSFIVLHSTTLLKQSESSQKPTVAHMTAACGNLSLTPPEPRPKPNPSPNPNSHQACTSTSYRELPITDIKALTRPCLLELQIHSATKLQLDLLSQPYKCRQI